jgi:endoribonuclease L-PSP
MQRRDLNAPDAPAPVAAYTQAIEVTGATRTLYISGQVGQRMDGTIPADIVEQSRLAWQNLEAQLKAAGVTLDNLVKTTILPNHGDLPRGVITRLPHMCVKLAFEGVDLLVVNHLRQPSQADDLGFHRQKLGVVAVARRWRR